MNTEKAAKLMIDGARLSIGRREYKFQNGIFQARDLHVNDGKDWYQTSLPDSRCWYVSKRYPIKYSKIIWVNKKPTNETNKIVPLSEFLLGNSAWDIVKSCNFNTKIKVTIEECLEDDCSE